MTVTHKKAAQILQAWNLDSETITDKMLVKLRNKLENG